MPAEALFIHFIPTRRRFAIARVCVVADRGLISAETLVGRLDELVVRFLGQDDRFSEHARRR